jgi:hypothetical protein
MKIRLHVHLALLFLCAFLGSAIVPCWGEVLFYVSDHIVGVGDVNNDDHDDYAQGSTVFSGKTREELLTIPGTWPTMMRAGDVNNDGFDDILVAKRADGVAKVFSGKDASELLTFDGVRGGLSFGGDVNADGYDDIIVGNHLDTTNGHGAGKVSVYSGYDGSTLLVYYGDAQPIDFASHTGLERTYFGYSVTGGDLNGDGFSDIVVSYGNEPYRTTSDSPEEVIFPRSGVVVFSGKDGSELYDSYSPNAGDFGFGQSGHIFVEFAEDITGDGFGDVLVNSYRLTNWDYPTYGFVESFRLTGGESLKIEKLGVPYYSVSYYCQSWDNTGRKNHETCLQEFDGYNNANTGFAYAAGDVDGDRNSDIGAVRSVDNFENSLPVHEGVVNLEPRTLIYDEDLHFSLQCRSSPTHSNSLSEQYLQIVYRWLGDLDGDGLNEYYIPFAEQERLPGGAVHTYDEQRVETGLAAYRVFEGGPQSYEGGDVNNDGFKDLVSEGGVISGKDGSVLYVSTLATAGQSHPYGNYWQANFPIYSFVADVNQDGYNDFILGYGSMEYAQSFPTMSGHVDVISGLDGSVLYAYDDFGSGAGVGDFNSDGHPDFVLAGKTVKLFSGKDGSILKHFEEFLTSEECEAISWDDLFYHLENSSCGGGHYAFATDVGFAVYSLRALYCGGYTNGGQSCDPDNNLASAYFSDQQFSSRDELYEARDGYHFGTSIYRHPMTSPNPSCFEYPATWTVMNYVYKWEAQPLLELNSSFAENKLGHVAFTKFGGPHEIMSPYGGFSLKVFDLHEPRFPPVFNNRYGMANAMGKRIATVYGTSAGSGENLAWIDVNQDGNMDLIVGGNPLFFGEPKIYVYNDQCPDSKKRLPGECGCDVFDTDKNGNGIIDCKENNPPTDIQLSNSSIAFDAGPAVTVGILSTVDEDADDSFSYELAAGDGDSDNALFQIQNETLKTGDSFSLTEKSSYAVRIRSYDLAGEYTEKSFVITVEASTDTVPPSSRVASLPTNTTASPITLTVSGTDSGEPASGIAAFKIYYISDHMARAGEEFKLLATLTPSETEIQFPVDALTTYWFRSIAVDRAGNTETKQTNDAYTSVGDIFPPSSEITAISSDGEAFLTLSISGQKQVGRPIERFDIYRSIDGGEYEKVAAVNAEATTPGNFSASYQAPGIRDNAEHLYAFYSRAVDLSENVEAAPSAADVSLTASFSDGSTLTATGIDVQRNANKRSYVRFVDILFDASPSAIADSSHITVERFSLDATSVAKGTGLSVPVDGISFVENTVTLDFGANAIGGLREAGDGFYRVMIDLDSDGDPAGSGDAAFEFYRLFGDANGDYVVNNADLSLIRSQLKSSGDNLDGDIDGSGTVTGADFLLARRRLGQRLAETLVPLLDD